MSIGSKSPARLLPLLYLGTEREWLRLGSDQGGRLMLLGGEPFEEQIVMWWNFIGRTHDDIVQFRAEWMSEQRFGAGGPIDDHFGAVRGFDGGPLPAPELPNATLRPRGRFEDRRDRKP